MILLDTHVVIWVRTEDVRLGSRTRELVDTAFNKGNAAVSAMTFWEAGMRAQKGGLGLGQDVGAWREELVDAGIVEIPVNGVIEARAELLPEMHGDSADRIIVATALEGHRLIAADDSILGWNGDLNRLDVRV